MKKNSDQAICLEMRHISKAFGGVSALRDVSLEVRTGEVLGLVGENGAGKSTLINIATGVFPADSGTISMNGAVCDMATPRQARQHGIAVVHQEAELFADLNLAENLLLGPGFPRRWWGGINWPEAYRIARQALQRQNLQIPVKTPARQLSGAQRVLLHIAAATLENAAVLFLDEPTAALTHEESRQLFELIRQLQQQGLAIVYVSHRLEEVLMLADRIMVLRDGETVTTQPVEKMTMPTMIEAMVGRSVEYVERERSVQPGPIQLEVDHLTSAKGCFHDVSIKVAAGEVVGLYGLVGAGRSELAQGMFGLHPLSEGKITVADQRMVSPTPQRAVRAGLAYLPEDRLTQGIFARMAIKANATMATLKSWCLGGLISPRREAGAVERMIHQYRIKSARPDLPINGLSGGNQQKVVLARWLDSRPKVLVLDEPTHGVDVGAKTEIHQLVVEAVKNQQSVLLISSDLPEVMALSDRVLVMCEGRISGEFKPGRDSAEKIAETAFPTQRHQQSTQPDQHAGWEKYLVSFREAGISLILVFLFLVMAFLQPESFLNIRNLLDILSSVSILTVLALGATYVIGSGGIDISVGSMLGLVAVSAGLLATNGWPVLLCFGIALLLACMLGGLNWMLSWLGRLHPIIVTLAGLSVYRGAMRLVTGGYEVSGLPATYRGLADGFWLRVPRVVWCATVVTVVAYVILHRTVLGRSILAVGNSPSAAKRLGVPVFRTRLWAFAINGAMVGWAALMWGAYYGKIQFTAGEGMELTAIAAAVIGGCNIMGGTGSIIGTVLGAGLIGMIANGLNLMRISADWQPVFVGSLILGTVLFDGWLNRRRRR